MAGVWAVLFQVLVGKSLPKSNVAPPPCSSANEVHAVKKREISVVRAFAKANVLITGAHGYVGSLVLEQLLRLCPTVNKARAPLELVLVFGAAKQELAALAVHPQQRG